MSHNFPMTHMQFEIVSPLSRHFVSLLIEIATPQSHLLAMHQ